MLRIWGQVVEHAIVVLAVMGLWISVGYSQEVNEEGKSVVVIIDSGSADLLLESMVRTTVEAELRAKGHVIVEGVEVAGETPVDLLACSGERNCTLKVLSGIPAEYVVFLSLRSDEENDTQNFKIVARNFRVSSGEVLARIMRRCGECKEELDLAPFSENVIADLLSESVPKTRPVTLPPANVKASLLPVVVASPAQRDPLEGHNSDAGHKGFMYAALGGGLVAVALGVTLVVVDGPVIEGGLRQPEENDTKLGGLISIGGGVALIGVSAWLWAAEPSSESGTTVTVMPDENGASIHWLGEF